MCEHKAYWGLAAIAKRLGYTNIYQPVRAMQTTGFLMFKRRMTGETPNGGRKGGRGTTWAWYTTEGLIQQWELSRCKLAAQDVKGRVTEQRERKKRKQALGIALDLPSSQNAIPLPTDKQLIHCGVDNSDNAPKGSI